MSEQPKPQSVVITDIRMPFGSMVVFMVKWTIAAIPALIILSLIGSAVFVGVPAMIGGYNSYRASVANAPSDNVDSCIQKGKALYLAIGKADGEMDSVISQRCRSDVHNFD